MGKGYTPRLGADCTVTVPDKEAAYRIADELAARGHRLVAVRVFGHFHYDPSNFWYGRPLREPELEGWWQVFSLDEGPYPSKDEKWWRSVEESHIQTLAEGAGGRFDGCAAADLETLRKSFTHVGVVHELDAEQAAEARLRALGTPP